MQPQKTLKDYSFRDQLQRAVISISNNVAEGFERRSNKELRQFLYIAKGSAGEARSMFMVGAELGHINSTKLEELVRLSEEISKMLSGFIKKL